MFIKQADLFWGMDNAFIKDIMDIAHKESHEKNSMLFRAGDPADRFFILLKGRIRIMINEAGQTVYNVSHAGDTFGWSSLVGNQIYTASAACTEPTRLLRFDGEELQKIMEMSPADGLIFYRRLSGMIGTRLIQSYRLNPEISQQGISPTFGTGQIVAAEAAG